MQALGRLLWPVILACTLSACVTGVDYGKIPHKDYVSDERCGASPVDLGNRQSHPYFFVTSRLPDCRFDQITLTKWRSELMRYGRNDELREVRNAKGDDVSVVPLTFQSSTDWWRDLAVSGAANQGRVMVYVHGFKETFRSSTRDTAQMKRLTEFSGPVVQYSWPSRGELLRYSVDEANSGWDETGFRNFLMELARQPWVNEIVLVSHSLGVRLVLHAVDFADANLTPLQASRISNIILASPDIDSASFERLIAPATTTAMAVRDRRTITIYTSVKDRALEASRRIHGYPRLGSPYCFDPFIAQGLKDDGEKVRCYAFESASAEAIAASGVTIIDTSDVSKSKVGHSDYLHSPEACADFHAVVQNKQRAPSARRVRGLPHVYILVARPKDERRNVCRD